MSLRNRQFLFSIVFLFLLFTSCGNDNSSKEENTTEESKTEENSNNNQTSEKGKKTILFFGNSLTAGYGLEPSQAFPALIQAKIDSLGLNYEVIPGGLSGETTAAGVDRIEWMLEQKVDILIVELGGNDGLRGIDPDETRKNLQTIIDKAKKKYPDIQIILAGMETPPNMGQAYVKKFRKVFPEIAKKNEAVLIPFLLENVGGIPELNLPDGIHPTAEGHQIVAETVWKYLEPLLEKS